MNWQREHERIIAEMYALAGRPVKNLAKILPTVTPEVRKKLLKLNAQNDRAVDKAMHR